MKTKTILFISCMSIAMTCEAQSDTNSAYIDKFNSGQLSYSVKDKDDYAERCFCVLGMMPTSTLIDENMEIRFEIGSYLEHIIQSGQQKGFTATAKMSAMQNKQSLVYNPIKKAKNPLVAYNNK